MQNEAQVNPVRNDLSDTIFAIGQSLSDLDPGALADLRRMSLAGGEAGAPYFWRLASRHDFGTGERLKAWARIVQWMAILTDKGPPDGKRSPHERPTKENGSRGLGHALCDGGDPSWGRGEPKPRPIVSELRFARLLAARGDMRAELLQRAVRALAVNKPPGVGINCEDIAWLLLDPDNPAHIQKLARHYYARLDAAQRRNADTMSQTDDTETGDAA